MSQQQIVTEVEIGQAIDQALADNRIVLFMKGTPEAPACGFSLRTVQALQNTDAEYVAACLGRRPESRWEVAARGSGGRPTVIRNEPFLDNGTPMPTRYWLVDPDLRAKVGASTGRVGRPVAVGGAVLQGLDHPRAAWAVPRRPIGRERARTAEHPRPYPGNL